MINSNQQGNNQSFPGSRIYNPALIFSSNDFGKWDDKNKDASFKTNHIPKAIQHLILADDDADDRELFAEAINESGCKVEMEFAEDGNQLLEILQMASTLPDLIFLDLNMPNKSGKECLDDIRKNERLRHIPVAIYSTSSSMKDIDDTYIRGANVYIRKPSAFNELLIITRKIMTLDWDLYRPNSSRNKFVFTARGS
jgi:CheY-like chemotaxis protein